jgi:hypothetical protein
MKKYQAGGSKVKSPKVPKSPDFGSGKDVAKKYPILYKEAMQRADSVSTASKKPTMKKGGSVKSKKK